MTTTVAARCPGAARLRSRWTARALAGAFLDLLLAWTFLCLAALAAAAARLLALLGLPQLLLPCTCARPHLPCLLAFLACYPARALLHLHASLRSRFPFDDAGPITSSSSSEGDGDPRGRELEEALAKMQRELEKERSASASAAEEAMAMILRLQKEKSALEIEARQQRRAAEERAAFHEDELEELRDIVLLREREARALRREVDAYRRLLGLAPEGGDDDVDEDEVMVTPRSVWPESQPSSSRSVGVRLGANDSGFSFQTPFLRQEMGTPARDDRVMGGTVDDEIAVQTPNQVPESRQEQDSCEDDGAEMVEILPLSAWSLDFDQGGGDFHVDAAAAAATKEQNADDFQEVTCRGVDKITHDHSGSENDANIYDVHVVDDICFSKEVKGLICRSFSDATIMQAERFQTRAAADDLLMKSLNAVKGAQDKIKHAASERRESMQLQLLEDIASQLQGIKDAAEAERHLYSASPKNSKKN